MPSYADMNGSGGLSSPINASYYSVDSPALSAASLPLSSPPSSRRLGRSGLTSSSTGTPLVSKMLKFTSERTKAMAHKYEALANKESSVKLSTLPAKLQPTLSGFDIEGDGLIDTAELGRATQMYQQYKARKAFAWLRLLGVLLCVFVAAYAVSRATVYFTESRYLHEGGLVNVSSSGFQPTVASALLATNSNDAAAAVANATYIPILNLLSVNASDLHRLTHLSLKLVGEGGAVKDVFYTVLGFEKIGQERLTLWTNRPGEEVLLLPGQAYRVLPPATPGQKPRAEDILDSVEGAVSVGSVLSSGLFVGTRPQVGETIEGAATRVLNVTEQFGYRPVDVSPSRPASASSSP